MNNWHSSGCFGHLNKVTLMRAIRFVLYHGIGTSIGHMNMVSVAEEEAYLKG
jgi:hypothetical protein